MITTGVGSPGTVSAASGGFVLSFNNLTTAPQAVLPADPQRTKITVHNPGIVNVFFAPAFIQNSGSDVALVPSTAALGGCFLIYANGGTLTIEGECQKAWQAFAVSATGNPLTIATDHI